MNELRTVLTQFWCAIGGQHKTSKIVGQT